MSQHEIKEIVTEFRESTCNISDEDVEKVLKLCSRKIEITGQSENYMLLLLPDELKNHCFRMAVNTLSFIRKECPECAAFV